jgi:hypothetical protein
MVQMKHLAVRLTVGLAFLIALGCGPKLGQIFTQVESIPSGKAVVYLYRPLGGPGFIYPIEVKANGTSIVKLPHQSYFPSFVDPGEIEFTAGQTATASESLTITVKAGQAYYVKTTFKSGVIGFKTILLDIPESEARPDIQESKLVLEAE